MKVFIKPCASKYQNIIRSMKERIGKIIELDKYNHDEAGYYWVFNSYIILTKEDIESKKYGEIIDL